MTTKKTDDEKDPPRPSDKPEPGAQAPEASQPRNNAPKVDAPPVEPAAPLDPPAPAAAPAAADVVKTTTTVMLLDRDRNFVRSVEVDQAEFRIFVDGVPYEQVGHEAGLRQYVPS